MISYHIILHHIISYYIILFKWPLESSEPESPVPRLQIEVSEARRTPARPPFVCLFDAEVSFCHPDGISLRGALEAGGP